MKISVHLKSIPEINKKLRNKFTDIGTVLAVTSFFVANDITKFIQLIFKLDFVLLIVMSSIILSPFFQIYAVIGSEEVHKERLRMLKLMITSLIIWGVIFMTSVDSVVSQYIFGQEYSIWDDFIIGKWLNQYSKEEIIASVFVVCYLSLFEIKVFGHWLSLYWLQKGGIFIVGYFCASHPNNRSTNISICGGVIKKYKKND